MMSTNRRDIPFESLIPRRWVSHTLKPKSNHPIAAIDTETYHGYVKVLADSFGYHLYNPSVDDILKFLTEPRFKGHHVFAYVMEFDADAIIKMLPTENARLLYKTGKTVYHGYKLQYIKKKIFVITSPEKHVTRIYDLYQYFESTLDKALQKYLNVRKTDYPHRKELNDNISLYEREADTIISYCLDDARQAAELGNFLQENYKAEFSFNPRNYISKASLAKDLIRTRGYVPDIRKIPRGALKYAFYSYKGGRFEMLQRGRFFGAELYDLNSAYPDTMKDLIDDTLGQWKMVRAPGPHAYYGFYLCNVLIKPGHICPLAFYLADKLLYYPAGIGKTYLTKEEIIAYRKYVKVSVINGWEFYPSEIKYPFREYMNTLFKRKQELPKDDYRRDLVKKMLNSVYGATYEKNPVEGGLLAGKLFNPVYASVITANTRIKVFLTAVRHEKNVIAFATDSILFDKPVNIPTSDKIGGWEKTYKGDAIVLRGGIYLFADEVKTRGMNRATKIIYKEKEYPNIFHVIRHHPCETIYEGSYKRLLRGKECMVRSKTLTKDDINTDHEFPTTFDINYDVKRNWAEKWKRGGDVILTSQQSTAKVLKNSV